MPKNRAFRAQKTSVFIWQAPSLSLAYASYDCLALLSIDDTNITVFIINSL